MSQCGTTYKYDPGKEHNRALLMKSTYSCEVSQYMKKLYFGTVLELMYLHHCCEDDEMV